MSRSILVPLFVIATCGCYPDSECGDCTDASTDADVDSSAWQDSDGDTISDDDEGNGRDTDGDTVPDMLDDDSDDDGWPDSVEAGDDDLSTSPRDSDYDDVPDFIDEDSDANGIDDIDETDGDVDSDGLPDRIDGDDDGDFCIDPREGSSGHDDTDGDTVPDHQDDDSDDDTIPDADEGCLEDCDGDLVPNRVDEDSDDNGIPDAIEGAANTDADSTTGPDDVPDWCDRDNDGDGLSDVEEIEVYGTDPDLWDTDGDGGFDYLELVLGTDPGDGEDAIPADTLIVGPLATPVTTTALTALPRVDVTILAGTGGDLSDEIADLQSDLPAAVAGLSTVVEDLQVALVAFEDFGAQGYGPADAVPVQVMTHATGDPATLAAGLADLAARATVMDGTIDERASGTEAVYQVLTGEGMSGIIAGAACAASPMEPGRFGAACMRDDAYSILAILSDRLTWSPQGCLSIDTECTYDDEAFPEEVVLHRYPQTEAVASALGVRIMGVTADPDAPLGTDHSTWVRRFGLDTTTVYGTGDVALVDVGTDATQTTELLVGAVTDLVTTSPMDVKVNVVDLVDADPQPQGVVQGYGLGAYPVSCSPASGDWGTCMFTGSVVQGVGPGVEVTIRLVYTPPTVHTRVDVLAFEIQFAVEDRLIVTRTKGWLVVPETWDPSL